MEKYQEARKNMDKYEQNFGALVMDLVKEQTNLNTIKCKVITYIAYSFARRLLIAIIVIEIYQMAWA